MSDALYDANWRLDVKTAGRAYRDTADVSSRFLALQDDCTYAVTCLKPMHTFFACQVGARKALCGEARTLVTAAAGTPELQRRSLPAGDSLELAHARRIECVSLRNLQPCAIPFPAPTAAGFDSQLGLLQRVE